MFLSALFCILMIVDISVANIIWPPHNGILVMPLPQNIIYIFANLKHGQFASLIHMGTIFLESNWLFVTD